jgi:hypothetical protein
MSDWALHLYFYALDGRSIDPRAGQRRTLPHGGSGAVYSTGQWPGLMSLPITTLTIYYRQYNPLTLCLFGSAGKRCSEEN